MRAALLCFSLMVATSIFAASNPPTSSITIDIQKQNSQASGNNPKTAEEQRGTEKTPAVVKVLRAELDAEEAAHQAFEHHEKPTLDRWLTYGTVALAVITAVLAYFTFGLWSDAREESKSRSKEMQASINEANRAASAMELLSQNAAANTKIILDNLELTRARSAQQMRAYLSVSIWGGSFQESGKGIFFGVNPRLLNSGNTPAHKVTYWASAAIQPFPLSDSFIFRPPENIVEHNMVLHPRQEIELNAAADSFVLDSLVARIKAGVDMRVHIWGIVTYTDVFEQEHTTKFCHSVFWLGPESRLYGTYANQHNEAT